MPDTVLNETPQASRCTPLDRAQGALLGFLCGDALGALVEFEFAESLQKAYPDGLRAMVASPIWNTLPGQLTDEGESAIAIARQLILDGCFIRKNVKDRYREWLNSQPVDCSEAVFHALSGHPDETAKTSQSLIGIVALSILGTQMPPPHLQQAAYDMVSITHPNDVCQEIGAFWARLIAHAITTGCDRETLFHLALELANKGSGALKTIVTAARSEKPHNFSIDHGWIRVSTQNALWHLAHTVNINDAITDTVMQGGKTDINAAVCGALLGSVDGISKLNPAWIKTVTACAPDEAHGALHPRHPMYWAADALELAQKLLLLSSVAALPDLEN